MSIRQGTKIIAGTTSLPTGVLFAFAGDTPPSGCLICDGSAISRTLYSSLFNIIGTKYGEGDGATTFNLPNFINKTFWGGSTSGTVLEAGLPNITGNVNGLKGVVGSSSGALKATRTSAEGVYGSGGGGYYNTTIDASRSNSIYGSSDTVQPPALQTIICIKY